MFKYVCMYGALLVLAFSNILLLSSEAQALNAVFLKESPAKTIEQKSSVIVVSRAENRTVLTVVPNYQYDGDKLAMLIPVPHLVADTQVRLTERALVSKILKYTAPRALQFKDPDQCKLSQDTAVVLKKEAAVFSEIKMDSKAAGEGVKVSALTKEDLARRDIKAIIDDRGYSLDKSYDEVFSSYLEKSTQFVWVEIENGASEHNIPVIQLAYESDNFILPVALSGINSSEAQELTLIFISKDGRVLSDNIESQLAPTDVTIPVYAGKDFVESYSNIFDQLITNDNFQSMFVEYAGDINWCPDCLLSTKLSPNELRALGAWWLDKAASKQAGKNKPKAKTSIDDVYVTRLHFKHTNKTVLGNVTFNINQNDKSRHVSLYKSYLPNMSMPKCEEGRIYKSKLLDRFTKEAEHYAELSGKPVAAIKQKMEQGGQPFNIPISEEEVKWWENMWDSGREK